ncbi:MAG: hypothetical protein NVSMB9_04180 [Isosphaeraceae bacterium]
MTWILIVLAVVVRVAAVLVLQSHHVPNSTYEHGTIAENLLSGRGFSVRFLGADGPTSQQAPVYPFIVAAAYAVGGIGTPRALLILELGQSALGGLLVAAVLWLACEVEPGRVWVRRSAGLIAALHPTLVYAATHVQVALLAATMLTFTLASAYRVGRTGRSLDAVITGAFLALLMLTDPILGLSAGGIGLGITARQGTRRGVRPLAIVALTAIIGVLPWTVRNYRVHGEFIAIKSSFGYAFWQGNCALSEGTDKVVRASVERALRRHATVLDPRGLNAALWAARHEAGYIDDIALTADDYRELAAVFEPERSRRLFRRALADLRSRPGRYVRLCLRRLRFFILFDETNPKTRNLVYRVPHLGLTAMAILGLALARPETRRRLGPTVVTAVLVAAFHALTIVSARFHIPLEPLLGLWASCALTRFDTETSSGTVSTSERFSSTAQPRLPTTSRASASIMGFKSLSPLPSRERSL